MIKTVSATLAMIAFLAAAGSAFAQSTARQILAQGMQDRGYNATYEGREFVLQDRQGDFAGLQVSEGRAWVAAGGAGSFLMIIRNTTNQAYCFQAKVSLTPADWIVGKRDNVGSVEPGQHEVLLVANVRPDLNMNTSHALAYWKPDDSRPHGTQCAAAEPPGVREWFGAGDVGHFRGSVR